MTALYIQLKPQFDKVNQHYEQQIRAAHLVAPGAQVQINWYEILLKFLATATQIVQAANGNEQDKRDAVIQAALAFWEQTGRQWAAQTIGHPFIFNNFIEPAIEKEIPIMAGGVYDALVAVVQRLLGNLHQVPAQGPQGPQVPGGFQPY